jgi:DnaD/phage-associated family protein
LRSISKLRPPLELLDEGLHAAVQRTSLLHLALPGDGRLINWYLVNTAANRAWVEQVCKTSVSLPPNESIPEPRPPLLALYEQNIGLVTPLLVEELREAEEQYPPDWIADAIREAVRSNARSWRYIRKVLERWASYGRTDAQAQSERSLDVETYIHGPYGHLFRRSSGSQDDPEQPD